MVKNYNNKMIEFVCSIYNNNNNQRVNDPEYLWELGEIYIIYIKKIIILIITIQLTYIMNIYTTCYYFPGQCH